MLQRHISVYFFFFFKIPSVSLIFLLLKLLALKYKEAPICGLLCFPVLTFRAPGLIGVLAAENHGERLPEDFQVAGKSPAVDILQVIAQGFA